MNAKICSIDGCEKGGPLTRGWCATHYSRWRVHGDPLGGRVRFDDPAEAFLARTEPIVGDPNCLIWTGACTKAGYGQISVDGRTIYAHRYAWEVANGPILDGLLIDHRCWNPPCVNVDHLRLATNQQNTQSVSGPQRNSATSVRGATRHGRGYKAQVHHDGTTHYLGTYVTAEEAGVIASTKRAELFGEFAGRS